MVSLLFIPFVIALYKLFCLLFLRSSVLSQTLHITTQLVRSCSFSYLLRTVLNTIIFVSRAMPFLSVLESFRSRRRQFHLGRHLGFIFKQKFQRHKRTRGKVCCTKAALTLMLRCAGKCQRCRDLEGGLLYTELGNPHAARRPDIQIRGSVVNSQKKQWRSLRNDLG